MFDDSQSEKPIKISQKDFNGTKDKLVNTEIKTLPEK